MHLKFRNVNDAFRSTVGGFKLFQDGRTELIPVAKTSSRVGDVLQIIEPVTLTYSNPLERVLFNQARDANPFFHLMEALWMLAGRRDIAPMAYYAKNYAECVQDGNDPNANGAYGYRWCRGIGGSGIAVSQLEYIIAMLQETPNTRRAVLEMWTVDDDLLMQDSSKDVCCNLSATFQINNGKLDMTVFNRSNDLVLGCLGANYVHFSFLLEYMAAHIGVPVGVYNQVTTNLHVYTDKFKPEEWLADTTPDYYVEIPRLNSIKLVEDPGWFDQELMEFNDTWLGMDLSDKLFVEPGFKEPFLRYVAWPMALAFHFHKHRDYKAALSRASEILADDWRRVATDWLRRRQAAYQRAADDGVHANPYVENEVARIQSGSEHS